jgi:hypothetical protein
MTAFKSRCRNALRDIDPSIALAQVARPDLEHGLPAHRLSVAQLIERAKKDRAEFMAALLRSATARLKSLFVPVRTRSSNAGEMVMETVEERS